MHGLGWYAYANLHQYHPLPCNLTETWLQINYKFAVALPTAFHLSVTWQSAAIATEQFL